MWKIETGFESKEFLGGWGITQGSEIRDWAGGPVERVYIFVLRQTWSWFYQADDLR